MKTLKNEMRKAPKNEDPAILDKRTIREIAYEIRREWKAPYFGAVPYLSAMMTLDTLNDKFGFDSARSIVVYFLANAQTWKGETARRVKKELNDMLKNR